MGADRRPGRQEQRQRRQPAGIARVVEIAVQEDAGETAEAAKLEVHHQEGEVVEHVDIGEGGIELDGVEQYRPAVADDNVAEVQIAVAMADPAFVAAAVEQRRDLLERPLRAAHQVFGARVVENARIAFSEAQAIAVED